MSGRRHRPGAELDAAPAGPHARSITEVVIYTKRWCSYCTSAKRLLRRRGIAFREVRAGRRVRAARRDLLDRYGVATFPQIVVGERHIGGADDLHRLDATGQLGRILEGQPDP